MSVMYDLSFVATMSVAVEEEDILGSFEDLELGDLVDALDIVFSADGMTVSGVGSDGDAEEAFEMLVSMLIGLGAERVTSVVVSDDGAEGTVVTPKATYSGALDMPSSVTDAEDPAQELDDRWTRNEIVLPKAW